MRVAQHTDVWAQVGRLGQNLGPARAPRVYQKPLVGVFRAERCHGMKLAVIADMYKGCGKSEMGCAAVLVGIWAH